MKIMRFSSNASDIHSGTPMRADRQEQQQLHRKRYFEIVSNYAQDSSKKQCKQRCNAENIVIRYIEEYSEADKVYAIMRMLRNCEAEWTCTRGTIHKNTRIPRVTK